MDFKNSLSKCCNNKPEEKKIYACGLVTLVKDIEKSIARFGHVWQGFYNAPEAVWRHFVLNGVNQMASPKEPFISCSHKGNVKGGAKYNGFTSYWWALQRVM